MNVTVSVIFIYVLYFSSRLELYCFVTALLERRTSTAFKKILSRTENEMAATWREFILCLFHRLSFLLPYVLYHYKDLNKFEFLFKLSVQDY